MSRRSEKRPGRVSVGERPERSSLDARPVARTVISRSVRDTEAAGAALAAQLAAGDCVCLMGPLGAGKTSFVRGAQRALGVKSRVTSPSFALAHESRGRMRVAHLDFYRLTVPAEERGLADYLDGRFIVFVEWADRDRSYWPRRAITVKIDMLPGSRRGITVRRLGR